MVQVHLMYNIKSHLTCFVATFKENIKVTTKTFGEKKIIYREEVYFLY